MNNIRLFIIGFLMFIVLFSAVFLVPKNIQKPSSPVSQITTYIRPNPLTITSMRQKQYPGSTITIEQTLPDGNNYHQYITSYTSDGLKIYALLTVPVGVKPKNGWPVILFNHGYIQPNEYQTNPSIGQYATYLPVFAENGYIVFKPDYRGNGNSEGQPEGAYYSPAYATDDLNALASIKKYKDVNAAKIGIWAHSMGGTITLRDLAVDTTDIKAAVIWSGVVGSYSQILNWHDPYFHPSQQQLALRNKHRAELTKQFGTPQSNPIFWNSIDPTNFVSTIITPIQLDTGGADEEVPVSMSQSLYDKLKQAGKTTEIYIYPGADHNISQSFDEAMKHSLDFFDKYLK